MRITKYGVHNIFCWLLHFGRLKGDPDVNFLSDDFESVVEWWKQILDIVTYLKKFKYGKMLFGITKSSLCLVAHFQQTVLEPLIKTDFIQSGTIN